MKSIKNQHFGAKYKKKINTFSVISNYRIVKNHNFKWEDIKILK